MTDAERQEFTAPELRERALARLTPAADNAPAVGIGPAPEPAEHAAMLHELRVQQVELELQNEELRRSQLELEASRRRWFELYDLAPVAYCSVGDTGLILQVNLAAAALFRQARAALAKRRLSEFIHPADRPSYYALQAQVLSSREPQSCELRLQDPPTDERWVQLTATAAGPDEQGVRSLRIVLQDISARREADAAQAALRLAERAQRNRSEFLSRVSHELRTPLNAIIGFSHLLLRNDELTSPPAARRQLQHILDAGKHLLQMVTDLLDVSRAESGRLSLQLSEVDVPAVLKDAMRDVAAQAQAAGITIEPDADGVPTASARADPVRLRQVFQNLLTNAIKYNHPGGRVSTGLERHGEHWCIRIADNGIGMTPQQLANLFEPFNRLGREHAGIEGTGLGLVITRDLVQAMGGRLRVHSTSGKGSEFLVDLVALEPARTEPPAEAGQRVLQLRDEVSGRLLCVENDRASRELISHILERRPGVECELVSTGAACIAAARRQWPQVLLLDLHLPDMHGLDVLKVLQQMNPHLPLQCVVISADCSADKLTASRAAGATAHLAKPVDPMGLLSMIDRLLEQQPRLERAPADGPDTGPGDG